MPRCRRRCRRPKLVASPLAFWVTSFDDAGETVPSPGRQIQELLRKTCGTGLRQGSWRWLPLVAVATAKVASEVKAADVMILFVKPLVYWTRFFIIATAFSCPQIDAIWSKMTDLAEKKYGKFPSGDAKPNSWTLLDYGDVVVHIFLPQLRTLYNFEEFHGNAMLTELPFESQPPFRPTNCSQPTTVHAHERHS